MKKQPAAAASSPLTPGLRRYLYFTAAITGAAILVVEILGAKMLAPYVGTSHFVWTAQIAVTLIALSAGYYAGGCLVDRSTRLDRLYACILVAGIYLCFSILVVKPVAYWCLQFKLAMGSLLASIFLFFVPLSLMAMVGPYFVRVLTRTVSNVGGTVGRLTALSTLGSVAGTVSIGYILIPFLPNSITMYLTAGTLFAVVAGYFLVFGRKSPNGTAIWVGMIFGLGVGWLGVMRDARGEFQGATERFRINSDFGMLQVIDFEGQDRRYFLNDYLTQNTYDPERKQSLSTFTYMLHHLARAYTSGLNDVLCIGLGVGIVPMHFLGDGANVDVVEINPQVVDVAKDYFDCDVDRLNLTIGDGRYFVNQATNPYDAIILDAFLGDSSPSHLMSREAFESMRGILRPEGVLVINSFGDFSQHHDFFTASLHKTLKNVFKSVKIHATGNGNVYFVASNRDELKILSEPNFASVHPASRDSTRAAFATVRETRPESGIILTDDYNPVEFYDAANREEIRRNLAAYMKTL